MVNTNNPRYCCLDEKMIIDKSNIEKENYDQIIFCVIDIKISSEVIDLEDGWCIFTRKLTKISVSPSNQRYLCFNEQIIIGKSSIESNNYDSLVFCVRNIKNIIIPDFITNICSGSFCQSQIERITIPLKVTKIGFNVFYGYKQMRKIEFEENSELHTIDYFAFLETSIEKIIIPSKVEKIGKRCFCDCFKLFKISNY